MLLRCEGEGERGPQGGGSCKLLSAGDASTAHPLAAPAPPHFLFRPIERETQREARCGMARNGQSPSWNMTMIDTDSLSSSPFLLSLPVLSLCPLPRIPSPGANGLWDRIQTSARAVVNLQVHILFMQDQRPFGFPIPTSWNTRSLRSSCLAVSQH